MPPTVDTVTVAVSADLNAALRKVALRRCINRKAPIDQLLERAFVDLIRMVSGCWPS